MRRLVAVLLVSMLAVSFSAVAESGVNESTSVEGTEIAYINHASLVQGGGVYDMYVTVNPGSNVTSVQWITQICINTGVCYPPEMNDMVPVDNDSYTATVDVNETASYINWKYILHSEDGSEASVPDTGFGWKSGRTAGGTTGLGVDLRPTARRKTGACRASQPRLQQQP